MYRSTKINITLNAVTILILIAATVNNIINGDWLHAICNILWIGIAALLIVQEVSNDKLRDENCSLRQRVIGSHDTMIKLNRKVWELSECKSCFFGTPDEYGIKCERHNHYRPGVSYCPDKISQEDIPEIAKQLRGFVNSVPDDVLLDSVIFNSRPCRFDHSKEETAK